MRIYEDNFAYELEQIIDPATQLKTSWRYNLYRVRPIDQKLSSGEAATLQAAEKTAKKEIAKLIEHESHKEKSAA
jgi:hypothetical protein